MTTPETEPTPEEIPAGGAVVGAPIPDTPETPASDDKTPIKDAPPRTDSRMRRWLRSLVRWVLLIVALFGVGVLTAYFLLYQPALERSNRIENDLKTARQELETSQKELQSAQSEITRLKGEVETATGSLEAAQNRAYLQMSLTNVANARLALANKDVANTRTALAAARADLEKLLPAVQAANKTLADGLLARIDLAIGEVASDSRTAIADLDVLVRNLQEVEKTLFP